jgi:uncharacterized protein (TIGR02301 family)
MTGPAPRLLRLGFGALALAAAAMAFAPAVNAQFFWSPWFEQPRKPRPRAVKPAPAPGDDLPPIVPRAETSAPPPPDDRPYDNKLLRLAEILGAVHYLRELCGAEEGQLWRDQMKEILRNEGTTAVRRAKLVNSFNDGYRGYRRTYRTCTSSATLAVTRFSTEGAQIATALAKPSHVASRGQANDATPKNDQDKPPEADKTGSTTEAEPAKPGEQGKPAAKKGTQPQVQASKPTQGAQGTPPAKPARQHQAN